MVPTLRMRTRASSTTTRTVCLSISILLLVLLSSNNHGSVAAFHSILPQQSQSLSSRRVTFENNNNIQNFHHHHHPVAPTNSPRVQSQAYSSTTQLNMFMGSDGGFLGIGAPELFLILLVGYFVLGPSDLFKLVKEIGKFIQNIRTFSTDLTTTFESNMENQLQLEELRKAQRELNDAFSFRRTINVDEQAEAFSTKPASYYETTNNAAVVEAGGGAAAAAAVTAGAAAVASEPPKKIRRRVRKKKVVQSEVPPELEMPAAAAAAAASSTATTTSTSTSEKDESKYTAQELAEIEAEFSQYTQIKEDKSSATFPSSSSSSSSSTKDDDDDTAAATAQSRFQQQLSGSWNEQILANQEKLEPLTAVMNKIALLEKEKKAAVARLEEEFQKRTELENKYYAEQRELLEQAARQVQDQAVGLD